MVNMQSDARPVSPSLWGWSYDFTHQDLRPLYTFSSFPSDLMCCWFSQVGQSQSILMTIGCELIIWIHGVHGPRSKQTSGRGPLQASCLSADASQWGRNPCCCLEWGWYVVGTRMKNICLTEDEDVNLEQVSLSPLTNMVDRDVQWHSSIWVHLEEMVLITLEKNHRLNDNFQRLSCCYYLLSFCLFMCNCFLNPLSIAKASITGS